MNPTTEFETDALESDLGVELKPNANRIVDGFWNISKEFAKVHCNGIEAKVMMDNEYACEWDTGNAAAETIKASHALVCITKKNISPWCEKPVEEYKESRHNSQRVCASRGQRDDAMSWERGNVRPQGRSLYLDLGAHDDGSLAWQAEVLSGVGGDAGGRDEQALAPAAQARLLAHAQLDRGEEVRSLVDL